MEVLRDLINEVLKRGLKTRLANDISIINAVRSILVNYGMTPHALTRRSPAELMLGRKLRGPLDTLRLQTVPNSSKVQDTNENEGLRADIQRRQEKVKSYVDKKRSARMSSFETGDWARIKRPQVGHKLRSQLSAPLQIRKKISNDSYLLSDRSKWQANNLIRTKAPPSLSSKLADLEHMRLGPLLGEVDQSFGIAGEGERNEQDRLEELQEQAPRRSTILRHLSAYNRDFVYQYAI